MNRSNLRSLVLALGLIFLAAEGRAGPVVQWPAAAGGNDHYYQHVGDYNDPSQRWSWQTSITLAAAMSYQGLPGHLVTITSAAESQFITDNFYPGDPWPQWIGLTDNEQYGGHESFGTPNPQIDGWVWVTGEPVAFTNWGPGQPDNLNNEDFAAIGAPLDSHSTWNDYQSGTGGTAAFIVEFEAVPEPSAIVLIVLGCAGLLPSAKRRATRLYRFCD
jgi:hypothetical protein